MYEDDKEFDTRRSLITGMGVAATGLALGAVAPAQARQSNTNGGPKRYELDSWMDEPIGDHRVFIDSARPEGGLEAAHYAVNILNAHTNTYGGDDGDYGMIVCFRRFSTPLGYNDAIWEKYGAAFNNALEFADPKTGEPFAANPLNLEGRRDLPSMGATIDSIANRGVKFAVCLAASRGISFMLAGATGGSADEIFEELTSSGITNSRFVPAGVMVATRAQEYGYSLLYSGL